MEPLSENEFRLLVLLSGNSNEALCCELLATTLDRSPPYTALSYVWGNQSTPGSIEVVCQRSTQGNRVPSPTLRLPITQSVKQILCRLRQPSEPRILWIDQLCIDQSNTEEKSAQVRKMGEIYSHCTQCFAYMGEVPNDEESNAEGAVAVIKHIAAMHHSADKLTLTPPGCMSSDVRFRAAMRTLGRFSTRGNQWWHRVWTLQEAMLPKHVVFLWGNLSLTWHTISQAAEVWARWSHNGWRTPTMSVAQIRVAEAEADITRMTTRVMWMNTSGEGRDGPRPAAIKWRDRVATDDKDNVYGLTGLYKASRLPKTSKCDYALSVDQVFTNFTLDLIGTGGGPTLFPLLLSSWQTGVGLPGLPRWVIDMRSEPKYGTEPWRSLWYYNHECCQANKGLPDTGRPQSNEDSQHILQLSGVFIDKVICVGPERSEHLRADILSWWNFYCQDERQHIKAAGSEDRPPESEEYKKFIRLVLGDWLTDGGNTRPHRPATDKDRQRVSQYLLTGVHNDMVHSLACQTRNRRFFITENWFVGLGHLETSPKDEVWIYNHGRVPFTARPRGQTAGSVNTGRDEYDFMSHCYVQGLMNGCHAANELGASIDLTQRQVRLH